jgi:uncharacterized membrane protein
MPRHGKVRIHQALIPTGAGAASGALWGTSLSHDREEELVRALQS